MSDVKERPILFSAPMVRGLLAGTKTQTRRIVKGTALEWLSKDVGFLPSFVADPANHLCPYGVPGDTLWVRETCRAEELSRPPQPRAATRKEREQLGRTSVIELDDLDGVDGLRYLADNAWRKIENTPAAGEAWIDLFHYRGRGKAGVGNQVPSIHMPRWASRISLKITDVRVERLRDISEADARAEGLDWVAPTYGIGGIAETWNADPVAAYRALWEHINGEGSWTANPWVWAVSFEVCPITLDDDGKIHLREGA